MNVVVITLFCITFVIGIDDDSLKKSVSVNNDAKELTELLEKIWSLKPSILRYAHPVICCEVINKCCKQENRIKGSQLMSQELFTYNNQLPDKIMAMCVNSSTSTKPDRTCSVIIKSQKSNEQVHNDPAAEEYLDIIRAQYRALQMLPRWFLRSCKSEHLQAYICASNTKLVEACARDILQMASDDDYIDYEELIKDFKRALSEIIESLSKKLGTAAKKQ